MDCVSDNILTTSIALFDSLPTWNTPFWNMSWKVANILIFIVSTTLLILPRILTTSGDTWNTPFWNMSWKTPKPFIETVSTTLLILPRIRCEDCVIFNVSVNDFTNVNAVPLKDCMVIVSVTYLAIFCNLFIASFTAIVSPIDFNLPRSIVAPSPSPSVSVTNFTNSNLLVNVPVIIITSTMFLILPLKCVDNSVIPNDSDTILATVLVVPLKDCIETDSETMESLSLNILDKVEIPTVSLSVLISSLSLFIDSVTCMFSAECLTKS